MNGFLFIDKPLGLTSFDVIKKVRKEFNERKVGHCGTLDPLASGLMIVGMGEGTKLLELIIGACKTYSGEIVFGKVSSTFDAEGEVKDVASAKPVTLVTIKKVAQSKFLGEIGQIPPKFSAKKIGGVRAYKMAREGVKFEMKSKKVVIKKFEILKFKWPLAEFEVECSSGTYIRSLANDLGDALKVGAYLSALRRLKIGEVSVNDACDLDNLKLMSIEEAFKKFPALKVSKKEYDVLFNGGFMLNKKSVQESEVLAWCNGKVVGILEPVSDGKFLKFKRRLNLK